MNHEGGKPKWELRLLSERGEKFIFEDNVERRRLIKPFAYARLSLQTEVHLK